MASAGPSVTPANAQEIGHKAAIEPARTAPAKSPVQPAATNASAVWLTTALAQAETMETANARGDTSVRLEPQPWIADAMMQALDLYESMAKQRQRQAAANARADDQL